MLEFEPDPRDDPHDEMMTSGWMITRFRAQSHISYIEKIRRLYGPSEHERIQEENPGAPKEFFFSSSEEGPKFGV